MTNKNLFFLIASTLLLFILAGCQISKSTPPPEAEKITKQPKSAETMIVNEGENPAITGEPQDPMKMLSELATQTAIAEQAPVDQGSGTEITPSSGTTSEEIATELPGTIQEISPTDDIGTIAPDMVGTPLSEFELTALPPVVPTVMIMVNIPTPTPGPPPQTYQLQHGEFPYCIARRYNVSVANLQHINNIGSIVSPGQILKIPQDGIPFAGPRSLLPHPTTYTVKGGDTIYQIACAYGDVDPIYIAMANNLKPPYNITAGQVLQIP